MAGESRGSSSSTLVPCHMVFERDGIFSVKQNEFTSAWKRLDPEFGRLICWILFSAGAEMFAKGICLLNGIDFRKRKQVPAYPPCPDENSMCDWAQKYLKDWKDCGVTRVAYYGTLGGLMYINNKIPSFDKDEDITEFSPPFLRLFKKTTPH